MRSFGNIQNWLDFHIFCGLLGPLFIVFHTDFKARGLVALSFWSMVILVISGLLGRYLYMQVLHIRSGYQAMQNQFDDKTKELSKNWTSEQSASWDQMLNHSLKLVHVQTVVADDVPLISIFIYSFLGEIALFFYQPASELLGIDSKQLKNYAKIRRNILYWGGFKKLLGYWHAFHFPFSICMYLFAVIHITVALVFQVKS